MTDGNQRGWWGRNRWWLLALPVALVCALASASYRVNDLWYENGWHREVAAVGQGSFVTTRHPVYDFEAEPKEGGPRQVDLRMRLGRMAPVPSMRDGLGYDLELPKDMVSLGLRLDFQAVKGKPAPYCTVYVVDSRGNRYEVEELDSGSNPCPPPGGSPEDSSAPRQWSRYLSAAVPRSAVVTDVWVGVSWPGYVRFQLRHPGRAGNLGSRGN
jgi:hypothetical protein